MYQMNEQFFTFKKILFYLKRYWWILALSLFLGVGIGITKKGEVTYEASALLLMNWDTESGVEMKVTESTFLYPVGDCIQLLGSSQLLEEVNSRLAENGLEPIANLKTVVSITKINASNCATLSVIGREQEYVDTFIKIFLPVFQEQIKEYYPYLRFWVIKESSELVETTPEWLEKGKLIFVGLLVGTSIILLLYFLDHRIFSREEVEQYFHIPYLGEIKNNQAAEELSIMLNYKIAKGDYRKLYFLDLENVDNDHCEVAGKQLSISWDKTDKKNLISFLGGLEGTEKDGFVFLIKECKTKRKDIQTCLEYLSGFDKVVLGYILIS